MLSEIYIKNYILVPELRLQFGAGLTVISGETGAGKSIIIGSIGLIFGESASGLEAFDKSKAIYLEATFLPAQDPELIDYLQQINAPGEEELILAREISVGKKSSYYIGGRKVSAAVMKGLKTLLIDFHHQRDQQKLLSSSHQLYLLDRYADTIKLRETFAQRFREIKAQRQTLQDMIRQQNEQRQKLELYRYQHEEIEKAALKAGEDTRLEQEYELLNHSLDILELSQSMKQETFEREDSIFDQLSLYSNKLQGFKTLNPALENAAQALLEAMESLRAVASSLSDISDSLAYDPARLSVIEARLDTINELLHKHKVKTVEELQQLFLQRKQDIFAMEDLDKSIKKLNAKVVSDTQELVRLADQLSDARQKAAVKLARELQDSIRQLAMKDAKLQIDIDKKPQLEILQSDSLSAFTESGQDRIELLFSANVGSSLKALSAVASGGELSRILLGIKEVIVAREAPRLLILDEIDAGIGGKTAESVAACISKIADRHPVFCITHLAQIAAHADTHIAVTKFGDTKTTITLRVLSKAERTKELARMLSGKLTDAALRHAEELRKL
ncbi:MAG: DNA repair protein RecN [Candidatus Cloacimonadaceae bacterium]|jgi:DNA repair protein RecN (Recombination protein N)|nr:DNA repair protein RecN [Candidatus Cloacimonadota bacterium]MDY0127696.1 DNA repair protein RecN [Candidatus Cloacimonadaceae bacterium]MCB5254770.1 DNA repair protein RecN [Candidatus Cloacimonadota bacterium]MCK9178012.1 DNA repair protein RecN [Candidatus Cloacimonadota bacterium]MCK9242345.1 DNA repair protein RecN [Candidatus Cloacimonadota bacterium]